MNECLSLYRVCNNNYIDFISISFKNAFIQRNQNKSVHRENSYVYSFTNMVKINKQYLIVIGESFMTDKYASHSVYWCIYVKTV